MSDNQIPPDDLAQALEIISQQSESIRSLTDQLIAVTARASSLEKELHSWQHAFVTVSKASRVFLTELVGQIEKSHEAGRDGPSTRDIIPHLKQILTQLGTLSSDPNMPKVDNDDGEAP